MENPAELSFVWALILIFLHLKFPPPEARNKWDDFYNYESDGADRDEAEEASESGGEISEASEFGGEISEASESGGEISEASEFGGEISDTSESGGEMDISETHRCYVYGQCQVTGRSVVTHSFTSLNHV